VGKVFEFIAFYCAVAKGKPQSKTSNNAKTKPPVRSRDQAIAACDGNMRPAIRALILANKFLHGSCRRQVKQKQRNGRRKLE